ncbi:MAG TPA: cytochrome C, partial [Burkholderiales bacterium]|nr:cytochrome C [Burkholderiales bacterium]
MPMQHKRQVLIGLALMLAVGAPGTAGAADSGAAKAPAKEQTVGRDVIDRGRYLLIVGNCNDCHTANFPERSGNVPESEWLLGNPLGLRGPWGTTYASNLRLTASRMSEGEWVKT